jgi:hypothetical protein
MNTVVRDGEILLVIDSACHGSMLPLTKRMLDGPHAGRFLPP